MTMSTGRDRLNEIIATLNEALGGMSIAPMEGPDRLICQEVLDRVDTIDGPPIITPDYPCLTDPDYHDGLINPDRNA
jgi:hypothetical protein